MDVLARESKAGRAKAGMKIYSLVKPVDTPGNIAWIILLAN